MRVGVLTSLFPTPARPFEGIFCERRYRALVERGHDVEIVHPLPLVPPGLAALGLGPEHWRAIAGAPAREERSGLSVHRPRYVHVPRLALGNARRFAAVGRQALAARPAFDVVVCDYAWPAARAVPDEPRAALDVAGWVVSGRGSDVLQVRGVPALRGPLARGLRAAGHWCGVSADLVRAMDELGEAPGRGVLVPNGVDLERFRPADRAAARARLGHPLVTGDEPVVLVVGHLIERKDPLLAARAFAAGAPPDARLVFIGRGPLAEPLGRALGELGIGDRAGRLGELDARELADWYAAADALLLTSHREGRPNVVLEALASGRPAVATAAGGTAELLAELPGCVCPEHDPAAIGAALARVLRAPPTPDACRATVAHLTWSASAERLESLLHRAAREAQDRHAGARA